VADGLTSSSTEAANVRWWTGYCGGRSDSVGSEQSSDRGAVIGPSWVGRDVKDHVILFLGDLPLGERAALALGGGERLQLLAEAGHRLIADFKKMVAASSAETAPGR
jgi:hypothetical protein